MYASVFVLKQPAAWDGGDGILAPWWDCVFRGRYNKGGLVAVQWQARGYRVRFFDGIIDSLDEVGE